MSRMRLYPGSNCPTLSPMYTEAESATTTHFVTLQIPTLPILNRIVSYNHTQDKSQLYKWLITAQHPIAEAEAGILQVGTLVGVGNLVRGREVGAWVVGRGRVAVGLVDVLLEYRK